MTENDWQFVGGNGAPFQPGWMANPDDPLRYRLAETIAGHILDIKGGVLPIAVARAGDRVVPVWASSTIFVLPDGYKPAVRWETQRIDWVDEEKGRYALATFVVELDGRVLEPQVTESDIPPDMLAQLKADRLESEHRAGSRYP